MGMQTVYIPPDTYSKTSGMTITDPDNMMKLAPSTYYGQTYAECRSQSSGYHNAYLHFDISSIPSNAVVKSFKFYAYTGASYNDTGYLYFYSGSGTGHGVPMTSTGTKTPSITDTWETIVNYADDTFPRLAVEFNGADSAYVYGATMEVTYFVPDTHGIFNLILPRG